MDKILANEEIRSLLPQWEQALERNFDVSKARYQN